VTKRYCSRGKPKEDHSLGLLTFGLFHAGGYAKSSLSQSESELLDEGSSGNFETLGGILPPPCPLLSRPPDIVKSNVRAAYACVRAH
jgi:hypothetical protein